MSAARPLDDWIDDDVIDALVRGGAVDSPLAPLGAFARRVQALGDGPAPPPSAALTGLLTARARSASGLRRKVVAGIVLATTGVVGAGAAGVLPAAATRAVREAIEEVSPVGFPPPAGDTPSTHGDRVSADATGESDGQHGVDGPDVADTAPGADHRADPTTGDVPGQTGVTGQDRAAETPAGTPGPATGAGQDDGDGQGAKPGPGPGTGQGEPPRDTPGG
jgi:hypothetical protein